MSNNTFSSCLVLQFRFTLLSHAACEAPLVLPLGGYTYGEKCLFLVNDWHASLVSVYAFVPLIFFFSIEEIQFSPSMISVEVYIKIVEHLYFLKTKFLPMTP
jgi:hypothetical protein